MENLKTLAENIVSAMQAKGALQAECYAVEEDVSELSYSTESPVVRSLRSYRRDTLKIKAIGENGKTGSLTLDQTGKEDIDAGVRKAIDLMNMANEDEREGISELAENMSFGPDGDIEPDKEALVRAVEETVERQLGKNTEKKITDALATHKAIKRVYANSNGVSFDQTLGVYKIDKKTRTLTKDPAADENGEPKPYDERIASEEARPLDEGFEGTLVLTPGGVKHFWWLMRLVSLSDFRFMFYPPKSEITDEMLQSVCKWIKRIGERVAKDSFTLYQKPLDKRFAGAELFTNDGYAAKDVCIVNKGVMETFPLSRKGALMTGRERSVGMPEVGNIDQDFNIYIEPGDTRAEDMVKSVEKGMLLFGMGGIPNTDGKLISNIKKGLLIENGAVVRPVSAIMVADFEDMHMNIRHISKETQFTGCDETPWISYDGVTFK